MIHNQINKVFSCHVMERGSWFCRLILSYVDTDKSVSISDQYRRDSSASRVLRHWWKCFVNCQEMHKQMIHWCSTRTKGMWCTQDSVQLTRSWVISPHWENILLLHPPLPSPNALYFALLHWTCISHQGCPWLFSLPASFCISFLLLQPPFAHPSSFSQNIILQKNLPSSPF